MIPHRRLGILLHLLNNGHKDKVYYNNSNSSNNKIYQNPNKYNKLMILMNKIRINHKMQF
jgi:hypothetical protein